MTDHTDPNEHPVMIQVRFLRELADRIEQPGKTIGAVDCYRLRSISYALEFMFTASVDAQTKKADVSVPENVRINAVNEKGRRVKPSDPAWDAFKKNPK